MESVQWKGSPGSIEECKANLLLKRQRDYQCQERKKHSQLELGNGTGCRKAWRGSFGTVWHRVRRS